jgi:hypothetical protein
MSERGVALSGDGGRWRGGRVSDDVWRQLPEIPPPREPVHIEENTGLISIAQRLNVPTELDAVMDAIQLL